VLKPQITNTIPNVENFLRHCQRKDYKSKSVVLQQGEPSDTLYLILDGSVSVMVEDESEPGHMLVVAYLNPGDFVGEMGLFDNEPQVRSAMVVAKTQCEVAEISYDRFHQIRAQYPDILYAVSRQLGARLRQTTRKLSDLAFVDVSGRIDPPGRHADQGHPAGVGQNRGLFPGDGGARAQGAARRRAGIGFR